MPDPSSANAHQVNYELGVANTTTLQLSNNWVKNLASNNSTSNSNISWGRLRWGINFPGRAHDPFLSSVNYNNSANLDLSADFLGDISIDTSCYADVNMIFYANGQMRLYVQRAGTSAPATTNDHRKIWLTSGVNSDYTVQLNVTSGALNTSSNSANTDYALSSDRFFNVYAYRNAVGSDIEEAYGNIIIKSAGTEIFRRPFSMIATAELQSL